VICLKAAADHPSPPFLIQVEKTLRFPPPLFLRTRTFRCNLFPTSNISQKVNILLERTLLKPNASKSKSPIHPALILPSSPYWTFYISFFPLMLPTLLPTLVLTMMVCTLCLFRVFFLAHPFSLSSPVFRWPLFPAPNLFSPQCADLALGAYERYPLHTTARRFKSFSDPSLDPHLQFLETLPLRWTFPPAVPVSEFCLSFSMLNPDTSRGSLILPGQTYPPPLLFTPPSPFLEICLSFASRLSCSIIVWSAALYLITSRPFSGTFFLPL